MQNVMGNFLYLSDRLTYTPESIYAVNLSSDGKSRLNDSRLNDIIKHTLMHFSPILYRGYLKIADLQAHKASRACISVQIQWIN